MDSEDPPGGASAAAAGLVNPFMARKAKPAWRYREALEALHRVLASTGAETLMLRNGVFRPAMDKTQARHFQQTASEHDECRWLDAVATAGRYPAVIAPHGGLLIEAGGAIDIPRLTGFLLSAVKRNGGELRLGCALSSFSERPDRVEVALSHPRENRTSCRRLLLTCGAGFRSFSSLDRLGLHAVKGQIVDVRLDRDLSHLPHLSGRGYVVCGKDRATIGSSFEHRFEDPGPDPTVGARLLARATAMLPTLRSAEIVAHRAGIRVTRAGHRLPVVGPLPRHRRVWLFTALGSKGLLMAPLIGSKLPKYLADERQIPEEIRL